MNIFSFLPFLFYSLSLFAQKRTEMTIHFDYNKFNIRPAESRLLDSLAGTFPENARNISIEIYGHCDSKGTNGYNDTLSKKRASSVKKYLLTKGMDLSLFGKVEGYGEMRPVADFPTEAGQSENRRVELVITREDENSAPEISFTKALQDTAVKAGSNIVLKNLNFIGGTHHLVNNSLPVLRDLLNALKTNENLVIEIEGHICCLAGDEDGYDDDLGTKNLSEERAKAIYTYLLKNHIAAERLSYKGYGHKRPIFAYPEKTKQQEMLNRRVEIKIISK